MKFQHAGLIGTHRNPLVAETLQNLLQLLTSWNIDVIVEQASAAALNTNPQSVGDFAKLTEQCDIIIAVGGDGNLLHAARAVIDSGIPVLGINRGQLGFLTDIKPDKLAQQLQPILAGNYRLESRALLSGKVLRNGQTIASGNALNDIVLFPGDIAQLIEFELQIDNYFVYSQRSDGLIISTPTGSTAYALSAGGPIMQPNLDALVLVPKLPHTLTSRPIVVNGDSKIVLTVGSYNKTEPHLSYDGQNHFTLQCGDEVHIHKHNKQLKLLHPESYDYYQILRTKLQWGTQLIPISGK